MFLKECFTNYCVTKWLLCRYTINQDSKAFNQGTLTDAKVQENLDC